MFSFQQEDVTYAELALPLDQQTAATMTVRRKDPPTEYAKLDLQRHMMNASHEEGEDEICDTPLMKNKRESAVWKWTRPPLLWILQVMDPSERQPNWI